jgi:hypothetical protein
MSLKFRNANGERFEFDAVDENTTLQSIRQKVASKLNVDAETLVFKLGYPPKLFDFNSKSIVDQSLFKELILVEVDKDLLLKKKIAIVDQQLQSDESNNDNIFPLQFGVVERKIVPADNL